MSLLLFVQMIIVLTDSLDLRPELTQYCYYNSAQECKNASRDADEIVHFKVKEESPSGATKKNANNDRHKGAFCSSQERTNKKAKIMCIDNFDHCLLFSYFLQFIYFFPTMF